MFLSFDHTALIQSLYIHWPFCPYKCYFCPFVAIAGHDEYMHNYHKALCKEIVDFAELFSKRANIKTIFFGGGTPSTYPDELLLDMFGIINNSFNLDYNNEISIELNPGTVNIEKLELYKRLGINRLSIGVQSLNDSMLKGLNRHQTSESVIWLIEHACTIFDNISIDLIIGMPGVDSDQWKDMIKKISKWPIKHISIYFLTVHEDTPLYFGVKKQKIILPPDDAVVELYYWTINYLNDYGFIQYEISNFSKNGYQARHNSVYWQRKPYKAFGLGACSFDGKRRFQNEKNLLKYMQNIIQGNSITVFEEELTFQQEWLEELMLGLRTNKGINLSTFLNPIDTTRHIAFMETVRLMIDNELLKLKEDNISLTPKGLSVTNEIIVKLSGAIQY